MISTIRSSHIERTIVVFDETQMRSFGTIFEVMDFFDDVQIDQIVLGRKMDCEPAFTGNYVVLAHVLVILMM